MNIPKISLVSVNTNFTAKKTNRNSNATPIIHSQADLYLSNDKSVKQGENNVSTFFNKAEAQFYSQCAKNMENTISDIRVSGYETLHDAENLKRTSQKIQENAKKVFEETTFGFEEGEKERLAARITRSGKRYYTQKDNKLTAIQDTDRRGNTCLKAEKINDNLYVRKYNDNQEIELFGFDLNTGVLREYLPKVIEGENFIHSSDYYRFDENGKISQYSYNYEENTDKSTFSMINYQFDNDGNLIEYSEDKETKVGGSEKNGIIYHFIPSKKHYSNDSRQNMEILSYSENTITNPDFGQKAGKKYVFAQDNLALSSYYKNLFTDGNSETANLVMLFDDEENLEEVRTKYQLNESGVQLANKVFRYADGEPEKCMLGYVEQLDGSNSSQKLIRF